jgi:hypothetical protein
MFERFTDRARRVVVLGQEEARMLNHNYIDTEHILLGLIDEGEGIGAIALESLGISLEVVRQQVEEITGQGQQAPSGHLPFTPRAKVVLELSLREALQLGHNYIGTGYILLGLIRVGDGVAAQVLVKLGADLNRVRQQVIQLMHGYQGKEPVALPSSLEAVVKKDILQLLEHDLRENSQFRTRDACRIAREFQPLGPDADRAVIEDKLDALIREYPQVELVQRRYHEFTALIDAISDTRKIKENAIDDQDFERAAAFRDLENQQLREKEAWPPLYPGQAIDLQPSEVVDQLARYAGESLAEITDGTSRPVPELVTSGAEPAVLMGHVSAVAAAGPVGRRLQPRWNEYADLDLAIRRADGDSFTVRVLDSPAGPTSDMAFRLPWSELELENFLLKIGHRPRGVRRIDSPQVMMVKEFGSGLYRTLFSDQTEVTLLRSISEATARGAGLRIRLRLTDAPELAALPWEFLYDDRRNRFLCLSERTPVVRYLEVPDPPRPLTVSGALRILVVISSPSDLPRLSTEQEWARLSSALEPLIRDNSVEVHCLEQATLSALRRALRRQDWNVLHFVGHGCFSTSIGDGVLAFEDEQQRSREVSGQDLGILLHDHDALRLVVLNACEGARADQEDPFSGSAQALTQQGVPAVVAMQFEISDAAAILFASEMYGAICDGYSLEPAVAAARKAIFTDGNQTEWATPVLYLRTPDGMIFNVQKR